MMNVTNWKPANSFTPAELDAICAGWADLTEFGMGIAPDVFLFVDDGRAVAFWDGYGCDSESMPENMLYVSGPDLTFGRDWTDGSFEAVRDYLAGWDVADMEARWNADSEKFESETGWCVVN